MEPGDGLEKRFTYADRETWSDERRWELVAGVAYAMSGPSLLHQAVLGEFFAALRHHLRDSGCRVVVAPSDVKLSEFDVVQPDLIVSCSERLRHRFHEGPPDLAVEILSPSTLRHDRIRKLELYARAGVPEYWLVTGHPFMVEVLENVGGAFVTRGAYNHQDCLKSARFADLELDLQEVWRQLPPQPAISDEVRETEPVYAG